MGPHGINRAVERLDFTDCKKGLGKNNSTNYNFFFLVYYNIPSKPVYSASFFRGI